ncbi:hypothetical protein LTR85_009999 [Meristemomyces frigidus]|nr:hypothetical protein LTR85_009999 [Meristemomyces frigidus]
MPSMLESLITSSSNTDSSTKAPSTLETLPTDIVALIIVLLPMPDLLNLRATSRRVEHETLTDFARRAYEHKTLEPWLHIRHLPDFADVVSSPRIGAAVRRLELHGMGFVVLSQHHMFHGDSQQAGVSRPLFETLEVMELLAELPNLQTLELQGLRGPIEPVALPSTEVIGLGLTSLQLSDAHLTSDELCQVLGAFAPMIRSLGLKHVVSADGEWQRVFHSIRSIGQLKRLGMSTLYTSSLVSPLDLTGKSMEVHKALKSEQGRIEHYWVKQWAAGMIGGLAVQAGLDAILGFIAQNQDLMSVQGP